MKRTSILQKRGWRKQMNKQEAIERIKNIDTLNINDKVAGQQVDMVIKDQVLDIVSQIDEPQKVVVPKFVAEWIKPYRHAHTLLRVLSAAEKEQITPSTVNDWILDNQYDNDYSIRQCYH